MWNINKIKELEERYNLEFIPDSDQKYYQIFRMYPRPLSFFKGKKHYIGIVYPDKIELVENFRGIMKIDPDTFSKELNQIFTP